jgi:autotransporter-associated beta strand protein
MDKSPRLTSVATGTNAVTFSGLIHETTGTHGFTKIGTGIVVISNPNNSYTANTNVNEGTLRVTGSIATSALVVVNNTGTFDAAATQSVRALTVNTGGVTKVTAGVLKVGDDTTAAPLTIVSNGTNTGKVDLTKRGLIVDYVAGNEAAALIEARSQILLGRAGGTWTGPGITSSDAAAAPSSKAVGYAQATEAALDVGGLFMGQLVDTTSVVARYTLLGDADLDGKVGFPDLVKVAQNYDAVLNDQANAPATFTDSWWAHGDFNLDGVVGFPDLVAVAQNYDLALPGEVAGASTIFQADLAKAFASVPEPSGLFALAIGAAALGRRRRRR